MRLDIDKTFREINGDDDCFRAALVDIQSHVTDRQDALKWIDSMRFLAPVSPSKRMRKWQGAEDSLSEKMSLQTSDNDDPNVKSRTICSCAKVPAFEVGQRRFRLTNPSEFTGCQHYVAVSYCWERRPSQRSNVGAASNYIVDTPTGPRSGKAPIDVVNRAVAFAAMKNLSLIWIDQEVIDQESTEDKSQGIQVMDIVFERSLSPIAILDTAISSQRVLDAFDSVSNNEYKKTYMTNREDWKHDEDREEVDAIERVDDRGHGADSRDRLHTKESDFVTDMIDLLQLLSTDLYFTRSWTLQESLSALNMTMLVRLAPNLRRTSRLLKVNQSNDLSYGIAEFNSLIEEFSFNGVHFGPKSDLLKQLVTRFELTICPAFIQASSQRISRSAAEVLAMLEPRQNSVLSDRLAIVSNLCSYKKRLNAKLLCRTAHGLTMSILVLATINGDLSLFSGYADAYQGLEGARKFLQLNSVNDLTATSIGWDWCPPENGRLKKLPYWEMRMFDAQLLRITPAFVTVAGLHTSGFLWKCGDDIEFEAIKKKCEKKWNKLRANVGMETDVAMQIKWEALLSLVGNGFWELAEAFWRFECYDGDYIERGRPFHRPYQLADVIDRYSLQLKSFDPSIKGNEDYTKLFREATSFWLQYSIADSGYINAATCISSSGDRIMRAAFDPKAEDYVDEDLNVYVFTPFIESDTRQYDVSPEYGSISWSVSRTGKYVNGVEILRCHAKLEGFWNVDGLDPTPFVLS